MTFINIIETYNLAGIEEFLQHNINRISHAELDKALNTASFYGDIDVVKLLIKYGADVNARQENNMTALNCAIENMHLDVIEHLIKHGANINLCDKYGVTPLHQAIDIEIEESKSSQKYPPSAKITLLLLANNPDKNVKDHNGRTPLDWAIRGQHTIAIELLNKTIMT